VKKNFDCVSMKSQIQGRIVSDYAGLPEREARKRMDEKVMKNPLLSPYLERIHHRYESRKAA
jgi:hypothetical protein